MTEQERKKMTLAEKLTAIMNEIGTVEKKGENKHSNYKYFREVDLFDSLRVQLLRYGVSIIPSRLSGAKAEWVEEVGENSKVTGWRSCTVYFELQIINSDNPTEIYIVQWEGSGRDKGEKGLAKAYTGAMKQCLLKLFMIGDGEADPEHDRNNRNGNTQQTRRTTEPAEVKQQKEERKAQLSRPLTPDQLATSMIANAKKDPTAPTAALIQRAGEDLDRILIGEDDRQKKLLQYFFGVANPEDVSVGGLNALHRWLNPDTPENRQYMRDEFKECIRKWSI